MLGEPGTSARHFLENVSYEQATDRPGSLLQHLELEIREELISIGGVKHAC